MRPLVLGIAFASLLSGCGTAGVEDMRLPQVALQVGAYGALSPQQALLVGPDANVNGIRDGIDRLILEQYSQEARPAAMAYARAVTEAMVFGAQKQAPTARQTQGFMNAAACLDALVDAPHNADVLRGQVLNSQDRWDAFNQWIALAGPLPTPDPAVCR